MFRYAIKMKNRTHNKKQSKNISVKTLVIEYLYYFILA